MSNYYNYFSSENMLKKTPYLNKESLNRFKIKNFQLT